MNEFDPTEGMSSLDKLLAGIGLGYDDTLMGLQQAVNMKSKQDVKDKRALNRPLLDTTAGRIGSVIGKTASMVPVAFMPGANTIGGAALYGTGMGLLQPSANVDEALTNALTYGLLGPASITAGRLGGGLLTPYPLSPANRLAQ